LAAAAPLGMPSGKVGHHPGWKPLQGSASDHVPGWAPSPCRLPGPVPRYETCLRRVFTAATVSSTPSRAPEKVVRVNPFLARLHYVVCMTMCPIACICIAGDRARRSAKQQPSSAATACGQRCATTRPENLCRARHVGHREEVERTRLSTFD